MWHITVDTGWTALDICGNGIKKKTEDYSDYYVDIMAIAGNPVCRFVRYTEERKNVRQNPPKISSFTAQLQSFVVHTSYDMSKEKKETKKP